MSMQELPDDQLDGLFRKSLEESEPPYDPAAWPMMAEKLAVHDRQQFWQRWLRRIAPVVVALVLPVSVWLLTRDNSSADSTGNARLVQLTAGSSATKSGSRLSSRSAANRSGSGVVDEIESPESGTYEQNQLADRRIAGTVPTVKRDRVQSSEPALAANSPEPADPKEPQGVASVDGGFSAQSKPVMRIPIIPTNVTTTRTARTKRLRIGKPSVADLSTAGAGTKVRASRVPTGSESGANGMVDVIDQLATAVAERPADRFQLVIEPLWGLPFATVGQLPTIDRPVAMSEAQAVQLPAVNRDRTTGLSLRAMVSPDLSSVGLTNFSRPGTNVGLMLEYQFQRWHVQAGVLRSVKVYQANESAYEYSAVRQWPVVPSSIDGRCNMLDIPINLRYDVALIPRQRALPPSRWFVSTGATTYYMLREDYTYKYDNPADPKIKYRDWTTETGRYGFSQLNLSVGYERAVTQRLFWQVEPFLKVPLKGVGYYKVNLLSTGAFFSLRYRL